MAKLRLKHGEWRVYHGGHSGDYEFYPFLLWALFGYIQTQLSEIRKNIMNMNR